MGLNIMSESKQDIKLSSAVLQQQLRKQQGKIECLTKAINKHQSETPDNDIRVIDQNLWSAGEMINYN
jgi:hypothetical protein